MYSSSTLSLRELPEPHPLADHRRRLSANGKAFPTIVNGDRIEFEFTCAGCTLLATSYDYFDGCSHWIYLLGEGGRVLDQLSMPDVFGFVQDVDVVSSNEIAFGYFGTNDRWSLAVAAQGFWSYAHEALARRPNRFLLSKRRLALRRTPGAPWVAPQPKR